MPRDRICRTGIKGEKGELFGGFLQRKKKANRVGVGWKAEIAGVGSIGFQQAGWRVFLWNLDGAHTSTSLLFLVYLLDIIYETAEYES